MLTGTWLHRKLCLSSVITGGLLSISLLTKAALAGYVPPADQEPPSDYTRSGTAGHRGRCQSHEALSLTLLAPQTHVGQTASPQPTFAWYIPDPSNVSVEFRLFEYDLNNRPTQPIATLSLPPSSARIRTLSLPEPYSLMVGKKYLWQIAIDCPDSQPDAIARADVKVVSPLFTEPVPPSQSANYAQAGLWYDALGQALAVAPPGKLGEDAATLLEELANLEANLVDSADRASNQVERLQQIAISER
ncbi:MAG: DUF928 domain-containing protein [Cyanophyceae cyanobacterium]